MIYFNDLNSQYLEIKQEINEAVQSVLDSGWYILGPKLEKFETEFARYIGTKHCVGVASGTEAIALSLLALDIGKGDEVITTNVTAFPTIVGIVQSGAKPVVVDVFADSGLLDYNKIQEKINRRTKAIVPVHLYGQSCDMNKIIQIAEHNHLHVVEDCAQSTGTIFEEKKSGTSGICGAFSFYPTKNLGAFGDGGAVVTNSDDIRRKLIMLRNYGQSTRYYHEEYGINSRLDEIQAAILLTKLQYVDRWNEKRIKAAQFYQKRLKTVECLKVHSYGMPNYHLFVIKSKKRDQLLEFLKTNEVQTLIHYPVPINCQKAFENQKDEKLPVSVAFTNEILSLPLYPDIEESALTKIVDLINGFKY